MINESIKLNWARLREPFLVFAQASVSLGSSRSTIQLHCVSVPGPDRANFKVEAAEVKVTGQTLAIFDNH